MSDFRLKVFYSVARNQSFTRAAKELFVSQPAVTKHIQELETAYQARLFDRTGNKLANTRNYISKTQDNGRKEIHHL